MEMVPGQGFYKGDDFDEKQKKYEIEKEKQFAAMIKKSGLLPLDALILDIQKKVNKYSDHEEIMKLAKEASKVICFTPSDVENKQLKRI